MKAEQGTGPRGWTPQGSEPAQLWLLLYRARMTPFWLPAHLSRILQGSWLEAYQTAGRSSFSEVVSEVEPAAASPKARTANRPDRGSGQIVPPPPKGCPEAK